MIKQKHTLPPNASYSADFGCRDNSARIRDENITISWTIEQLVEHINQTTIALGGEILPPSPPLPPTFIEIMPKK